MPASMQPCGKGKEIKEKVIGTMKNSPAPKKKKKAPKTPGKKA